MTTSPAIYAAAARYLGTAEITGQRSNPQISAWIRAAADWLDPEDSVTAWCGAFRGAIGIETATGLPPAHYRAAAWATWGKPVSLDPAKWQQGDTIIIARPGGNHVTLLDRVAASFAYCLGGNQGDAVNVSRYSIERITAVRRLSR